MESAEHRLKMCEIAAKKDGRIKVSDFEIYHELNGETYQLVKCLLVSKENPLLPGGLLTDKFDFSMIIGMDNANSFDKWVNYQLLETMIRFVVVPRAGITPDPKVNWYLKPPHIYLADTEENIGSGSSTTVRNLLSFYHPVAGGMDQLLEVLDREVLDYIIKYNLYGIVS